MKANTFDPHRIDVAALAAKAQELSGEVPLSKFQRVSDYAAPEAKPGPDEIVSWHAQGELRRAQGGAQQVRLHIQANTALSLTCQRCLQPVRVNLGVDRDFRFVEGEEAAAAQDAESEDDVLATTAALNLLSLIEDELVLGLPWGPRHDECPSPLLKSQAQREAEAEAEVQPEHPFAALAQLKKHLDS